MPRHEITLPEGLCICRDPKCTVPFGYCHCGWCGKKTEIATQSRAARGWVKNFPKPFSYGHRKIVRPAAPLPSDSTSEYISLTKMSFTIVDREDYERFYRFTFHLTPAGYAARHVSRKTHSLLHREIIGAPDGVDVDHINGNPLDNRKCNLRFCTPSQNSWNRKKFSNNSSGYTGVYWIKKSKKWLAMIMVNGVSKRLGLFEKMV